MQKLKSVLHRKKRSGSTNLPRRHGKTGSPRVSRQTNESEETAGRVSVHSKTSSQGTNHSRPISSIYSSRRASNPAAASEAVQAPESQPIGVDYAEPNTPEPIQGSIANDYKTYISAFPPETGPEDDQYMTLGRDRRFIIGESEGQHKDDMANRNMNRYSTSMDGGAKPLPALPVLSTSSPIITESTPSQRLSNSGNSYGSTVGTVSSDASAGKHIVSNDVMTKGGLIDSIMPRTEASNHDKSNYTRSDRPIRSTRDEGSMGWSRRKPHASDSDDNEPPQPPAPLKIHHQMPSNSQHKPVNFQAAVMDGLQESEAQRQLRLDGVVDLRNTVDTDADVHWAPAVKHRILKPHQHEIIQQKIYREIHNYDVYHRIQPVIHTEVLPPRHWIPNPDGEGLIEISAEELPARTGKNRWWSIVQHNPAPITYERTWRTEPEYIEGKTSITAEGFERKETTILHPPTLADLSGYVGPVQPIHFDHKTGERWWGEITTMDKLKEQIDRPNHPGPLLNLDTLAGALPDVPSSPPLKRKPVPANGIIKSMDIMV